MQITSQSVYRPLKVDRKKQNSEASSDSDTRFNASLEAIDEKLPHDRNRQDKPKRRSDPDRQIDVKA